MKKIKKKSKGFSLIELMVVVAIIGILSAVAIPQYRSFQTKARQSEAKSDLGAIYSAEAAYYAEWNQYYGDVRDIGASAQGEKYYKTGFVGVGPVKSPNVGLYSGTSGRNELPTKLLTYKHPQADAIAAQEPGGNDAWCAAPAGTKVITEQTFLAGSCGNIDGDAFDDEWTVDHEKNFANTETDVGQ